MKIKIEMVVIRTEGKDKKIYVQCQIDNVNRPSIVFTESELNDDSEEKEIKEAVLGYIAIKSA